MKRFTPEEDLFLKSNYHTIGLIGCSKALNRSRGCISGRCRILKLPPLSPEVRSKLVKENHSLKTLASPHKVCPEQFMNVTTPEVAYLLGLIWADGYVHDEKVTLTCVKEDAIEYMPTFLKTGGWGFSDYQLERYGVKMKPSRTIRTGNVLLARYLISQGYRSKSCVSACQILSKIPANLRKFWFRGLIDGDGYISYSKRGMFWIRITSSFDQDWTYMSQVCDTLGVAYWIRKDRYINRHGVLNSRSVFNINRASGVKLFCDYIFGGREVDNIGLSRKYLKWKEIESFMKTRPKVGKLFDA